MYRCLPIANLANRGTKPRRKTAEYRQEAGTPKMTSGLLGGLWFLFTGWIVKKIFERQGYKNLGIAILIGVVIYVCPVVLAFLLFR